MKFEAREFDQDADWRDYQGFSEEEVAEACAEQVYDDSGGECNATAGLEIEVRDKAGVVTRWSVDIEFNPSFSATLKKDETS